MGRTIDLLGLNAGYFLGYDGRRQKYLRYPLRSIVGSRGAEMERLDRLVSYIDEEKLDIIGLVEVDQGSIRTRTDGQVEYIEDRLREAGREYGSVTGFKYRDMRSLEDVPVLASMSNGALFRDAADIRFHHLHRGWKRLLMEIRYPDVSVFVAHLPYTLFKRTQQRQLAEISEILEQRDRFVLFGDFNIDDLSDLDVLREQNDAVVHSPGDTYPLYSPAYPFDLVIPGRGVTVEDCWIPDLEISDHLPVRATVRVG